MKLPVLRRSQPRTLPGVSGTARLDTRTDRLIQRLRPGDIAIIDHIDIDRASAEALVGAGVAAVLNIAPSISGRFPNLGPDILLSAGIPLVDDVTTEVLVRVREGETLRLDGAVLLRDDTQIATGVRQTVDSIGRATERAQAGFTNQVEAFAANTAEYFRRERDLLLDGGGVPDVVTDMADRHVVIVVRGCDYGHDLALLRPYVRDRRPILIGVDAGADALIEARYRPDLIVGDLDTVSDRALRCGAELIQRSQRGDRRATTTGRLERLGLDAHTFDATASAEDLALLLADSRGAALIVTVGTRVSLLEILDKGRSGTGSAFLTRLRVGGKLVDANAVGGLYRPRIRVWSALLLLLGGLVALGIALAATPAGQHWLSAGGHGWAALVRLVEGLLQ